MRLDAGTSSILSIAGSALVLANLYALVAGIGRPPAPRRGPLPSRPAPPYLPRDVADELMAIDPETHPERWFAP